MLGRGLHHLLGLFLESPCPLCQRLTSTVLCRDCERRVQACEWAQGQYWQGTELPVLAWGRYGGALKQAIAALKYHNHPQLAQLFAPSMVAVWQAQRTVHQRAVHQQVIVVPVPMHASKKQQRGFDQAELLARRFCEIARLPFYPGLQRIRATEAQFSQASCVERQRNLQDAFAIAAAWQRSSPTQPVLLLDDIYTTGATAHSAAQTLQQHGIQVCGIIVLARAGLDRADRTNK